MSHRYWVATATTGKSWHNTANWSATSGGTGGASVPGLGDTAIFDKSSGNGSFSCHVYSPATVDAITTTGFGNDLVTLAPLTCASLEWAGKRLLLAESQIGLLDVLRSSVAGSTIHFNPWDQAGIINPKTFQVTPSSSTFTITWEAVPGATEYVPISSSDGGKTWTNPGVLASFSTNSRTFTGANANTDYYYKFAAVVGGVTMDYSEPVLARTTGGIALRGELPVVHDPNPIVPQPLFIGKLQVGTGSNTLTIRNDAEVQLLGNLTIPTGPGVTVSQTAGTGKFVLAGMGFQIINPGTSIDPPTFSLDKPAGTVLLNGAGKLRSDLLRAPGEIDPRTATTVEVIFDQSSDWEIVGDVACAACGTVGNLVFSGGATLDTYLTMIGPGSAVTGSGTIRVHRENYSNYGTLAPTVNILYWNEPVTNLQATSIASTSIALAWDWDSPDPYPNQYLVAWAPAGTNSWTESPIVYQLAYQVNGLTPSTAYDFRVRGVLAGGLSAWSEPITATTTPGGSTTGPPSSTTTTTSTSSTTSSSTPSSTTSTSSTTSSSSTSTTSTTSTSSTTSTTSTSWNAPQNVSVVAENYTTNLIVSWTAVTGATSYVVEWSANGSSSWTALTAVNAPTLTQTHAVGTGNTSRYYQVKAQNASADSIWSMIIMGTTAPAAPGGIIASVISGSQIDLAWAAPSGATGYKIEHSTDQSTWTLAGTVTGSSSSVTGLTASTLYYFRISAYNTTMAYSPYATTSATTLASTITTAPTLSAGTTTVNSIVLNWTTVSGATGYRLERLNGANWESIYTGTALTHTHSSLTAGTDYSYRVFATNTGGDSPASSTLVKRTLCAAPTSVTATAQDQTTDIVIGWPTVTGATSYVVEWSANGSSSWTALTAVNAPTQTQTHAVGTANTTRYYRVKAVNASGDSAWSDNINTKTAPAAPTNFAVGAITQNTVALSLTAPTGATQHKFEYKKTSAGAWTVFGMPGAGTSVTVTGLDPNTEYDFRASSDNL